MKTLSDICEVYSGFALKEFNDLNEGIPVIKIGNIMTDGTLALGECQYTSEIVNEKYYSKKGDIYVALSGATTGKIGILESDERHVINQRVGVIRRKDDEVPQQFIKYFLMRQTDRIMQEASGCAQPNISPKQIAQYEVPRLSKTEMYEISTILDMLSNVITQRKDEIQKLEALIKARFVELFGNIKTNEFGWERCTFKDVSTKITDGEHGTVPRVNEDEGFLYFMARNITKDGEIDLSETSYVPKEIHEKIYKRCNPEKNDLLLVCVGATIGKCALVPEAMKAFSMARSVALIKPNKDKVTSTFLINLLRSEEIQKDIDQCSHAAAQAGLYTNMINNLDAFVPPMKLQMEFEAFCKQVDKSKLI